MEEKKGPLANLINDAVNIEINNKQDFVNLPNQDNNSKKEDNNLSSNILINQDNCLVKWFSELTNKDIQIGGGKGASLGEMYNHKFPVPPGFVITAQAFKFFIEDSGIGEKINRIIENVDNEETVKLQQASKEIRKLIEEQKLSEKLKEEVLEAYHILSSEDIDSKGVSEDALNILKNAQEPIFVSVRSSATTEDLVDASFAGQQESFLNIKGDYELIEYIKKCFSSLYTPRAIYYRNKKGFKEGESFLAVVVQKMVDSLKSGVVFSRNPINLADDIPVEAVFGLGEGIVSGRIKPDHYVVKRELIVDDVKIADKKIAIVRNSSGKNEIVKLSSEKSKQQVLTNGEILEVADYAIKLEDHYKKPQDIEFAIEDGKVYILQSRPVTTGKKEIGKQIELSGNILIEGLGSSPGIGVGVVKIIEDMESLYKIHKGDVLVTEMTNPDMVVAMQKSAAIVTDEGGMTAHASIVSREMGIPCVVGTGEATKVLKEGMKITVDGYYGKVYEGQVAKAEKKEVKEAVKVERVKLKVIVDLPEFAERAAKSGIEYVGLTRIEGMIASMKKHPLQYEKEGKLEDYTNFLSEGINKISKPFKEVWVRASDIRTDEYASLEGAPEEEINPMLGNHGIRFSLKHPDILKAELQAICNVSKENPEKIFGIMFPQVISIEEVRKVKEFFNKIKRDNMKFGVMIETPASVQIIEDICSEVDFISFGTNDLTQFTLGVDRGEDEVQDLYDEMHPAIFSQIKRVIGACRRNQVETSICGQAGSRKEMVEFLFKKGIDSISVNADAAYEISLFIKELEDKREREFQEKQKMKIHEEENERKKEFHETKENQVVSSEEQKEEIKILSKREKRREKRERWKKRKKERIKQEKEKLPVINDQFSKEPVNINEYKSEIKELERENNFLDKNKIKIPIEVKETNERLEEYKENIGAIEPINNLDRVEDKGEDIEQAVDKENQEKIEKAKKFEDNIKTSGEFIDEEKEESESEDIKGSEESEDIKGSEESEDIKGSEESEKLGVYESEQDNGYKAENYNFDEEKDYVDLS